MKFLTWTISTEERLIKMTRPWHLVLTALFYKDKIPLQCKWEILSPEKVDSDTTLQKPLLVKQKKINIKFNEKTKDF